LTNNGYCETEKGTAFDTRCTVNSCAEKEKESKLNILANIIGRMSVEITGKRRRKTRFLLSFYCHERTFVIARLQHCTKQHFQTCYTYTL